MKGLLEIAVAAKRQRQASANQRVVFISHSSRDKGFVRQLASDLVSKGVHVWLDEQRIRVGDSVPEKVAQGLAESDFLLIVLSKNSTASEWVKKEMNTAVVKEIERRRVVVLPVKLDDCEVPSIIADKKYADFTTSYEHGLAELLAKFESLEGASNE